MNKEYDVLVNRKNKCPNDLNFKLVDSHSNVGPNKLVEYETFRNWLDLKNYALMFGLDLDVDSAYRSKEYQEKVMKEIIAEKGIEYAKKFVAEPGYSEHQTGLAIDVCLKNGNEFIYDDDLINTDVVEFIEKNAYKFGFVLRYPNGKEDITGYNYEPWHIRYVGIELAKYLYENDLTLEEYHFKLRNSDHFEKKVKNK